jgi:gamma-glutamylcyclotransferase (GGCT)/AIG2-like uncharacterized protein YtfP
MREATGLHTSRSGARLRVVTKSPRRRLAGWSSAANEIVSRLFVYGTFRSGQPARAMIANHVKDAAAATMTGLLYALAEGYPGMLPSDDQQVIGELLELTDLAAALALLDAYEGDAYERVLRQAQLASGEQVWAWCYMLLDPAHGRRGELIPHGDWLAWHGAKR